MTATFGKLEHETLTLKPGLNIITAPNEWGKSTWCAFLVNMLYGLDTRAKSTKTALADKERYAPWSGSPMSGRIDLCWDGRDITVERWTKGRVPLGEFRAYETESGYAVPELTALNCGEMLLGVERSVFQRSSFLRLADLPVTQDESLRRRLNALVTTGDESGSAELLAQQLKTLKNKIRHNRTGLLPQAEGELARLEEELREAEALAAAEEKCRIRLDQVQGRIGDLNNHLDTLRYAASLDQADRLAQSEKNRREAEVRLEEAQARCRELPSREEALRHLDELGTIAQQAGALEMESRLVLREPEPPTPPPCFQGMSPENMDLCLSADAALHKKMSKLARKPRLWCLLPGFLMLAAGLWYWLGMDGSPLWCIPGGAALVLGVLWLILALDRRNHARAALHTLFLRYGSGSPKDWYQMAREYQEALKIYEQARLEYQDAHDGLEAQATALQARLINLCGGQSLHAAQQRWKAVVDAWDELADARRDAAQAAGSARLMAGLAKPVSAPSRPDNLVYTETETLRILSDATQEQQELQHRLGQYQGRMEALGHQTELTQRKQALVDRIQKLGDHYAALEYAQTALADAAAELQRRFAPKISARAQALFSRLTEGKYDRFSLSEDLSVNAGAAGENVLRTAQWRSDGTADQLYLALRLAVAGELTPDAPLILDDALVRFDDRRLKTALDILREEAENKQVILFTCQTREANL